LEAWRFGYNWREIGEAAAKTVKAWIPWPNDTLQQKIEVMSRELDDPDFLRPAADSALGKAKGAGASDKALPSYVGAIAPQGANAWDWSDTWKKLVRKQT
jgi:hypothetical protein